MLASAFVVAGAVVARSSISAADVVVVPKGDILAVAGEERLLVLDASGRVLRRLPSWDPPAGFAVQGLEVAPDRTHAFLSVSTGLSRSARLYEVDLLDGSKRVIAHAVSPALSPDGTRLLYLASEYSQARGFHLVTALVVRSLSSGRSRVIPLGSRAPLGTPPELVTNWSPDGRHAAVFDGRVLRLVDTSTARSVESEPVVRTSLGSPLAPVFLDDHTLVLLADCCIGSQHLVAVDLRSGRQAAFARISSPVVSARRFGTERVIVTDQLGELLVISRGHVERIATRVGPATV